MLNNLGIKKYDIYGPSVLNYGTTCTIDLPEDENYTGLFIHNRYDEVLVVVYANNVHYIKPRMGNIINKFKDYNSISLSEQCLVTAF